MARTLQVKAEQDFWKRFVGGSSSRALQEIIWNSFDADADTVSISIKFNPLGQPDKIVFEDNGEGIPFSESEHQFEKLGNSWKARAQRSNIKKRILHGRNGEGRFRALSLGQFVEWHTVYQADGKFYEYKIVANSDNIGYFEISDVRASKSVKTGTTVEITNIYPVASGYFLKLKSESIAHSFASYMNKYRDITLRVNGEVLDISKLISRSETMEVGPVRLVSGRRISADLEIIQWNHSADRHLYLCDARGFTLAERAPEVRAPGYNFSAYLKSDYFSEVASDGLIEIEMEEGISKLIGEGRDKLTSYFKQLEKQKVAELIDQWKNEKVYPYKDDESGEIVKQSMRIFNICAVTISNQVKGFSSQDRITKSLSFRLLREAIEERPSEVSKILSEVLSLSSEKKKQFANLLDDTKLSDIIDTVSLIRSRIRIAKGLRSLVCSDESRPTVKERQHIHQIVERNAWIFGDEFMLGISESTLTNALREHLRRLKINEKVLDPVIVNGKNTARLDLMLCQASRVTGRDDDHHLVIELKRAKKTLDMKDFTQIMGYASSIMKDSRYRKTNVRWSFWLVGVEVDSQLEDLVSAPDRPPGCAHIFKEGNGRIFIKTWGQLLHECVSRLEFIRDRLDIAVTDEESVSYLNEIYPHFVPEITKQ
ncbi:ATP-binding protein [Rhizobium oryzicola]|uniref:ATP-binding protein n=1 Tax=Rhizobium oryzicola TaxID=1232668 RepID=A0ABT8T2L5_9HYPH|nr:ATP-binding protein [Rhizobium oryzicola]MDO1584674.1 ATP-binding protein [Rhizobium oryzicola]